MADSLRMRVARLRAIAALPDSVKERAIDEALKEFGGALENLSQELSQLDLRIEDQAISLHDRVGGGRVRINIPPDLGERISEGISSITATILNELPDTLVVRGPGVGSGHRRIRVSRQDWKVDSVEPAGSGEMPEPPAPPVLEEGAEVVEAPNPRQREVGGSVVRVLGDVEVAPFEVIHGDVIALFGTVTVRGKVDGRVVSVAGNVDLAAGAEVEGGIFAVLGRVHRNLRADVGGSVFALDSGLPEGMGGVRRLLWGGWSALVAKIVFLLATALMLMLIFVLTPRERLDAALGVLCARPAVCLGQGLLWLCAGHLLVACLLAVLILTLIGIPLALLLGLAYLAITALALGITSYRLGVRAVAAWRLGWTDRLAVALFGLALLHLPGLLGGVVGLVPGMSPVAVSLAGLDLAIKLVTFSFGLGALALSRFGRRALLVPPPPPSAVAAD